MRAVAFGIGLAAGLGVVSVAAASLEDPDAPVTTARYAVATSASTEGAPAESAPAVPAADPAIIATQATDALSASPMANPIISREHRRFDLALDDARSNVDAVAGKLTGLAADRRLHREAMAEIARFSSPLSRLAQDQNIRRGFGEMQAVGQKARVFLFAGDQGGVLTYNFTHETTGVKAAGWTTERADQTGDRRIGFAWESGRTRIALTGMERKFSQFGMELRDRVVAMSLSIHPGWSERRDRRQS